MLKRLLLGVAIVATVSTTLSAMSVNAKHGENTNENKITICHRTNSTTNPYVVETVSKSAANGGGHDDHTSHTGPVASSYAVAIALKSSHTEWGDIIPAYTWDGISYPGLNWTIDGQSIYNNHCDYPAPSTPVEPELKADVKYSIICEVLTQNAKITFTNNGIKSGQVELNGTAFSVAANVSVVKNVAIAPTGTALIIKIDGVKVFDEVYKCVGGQGGGVITPTPGPVVTNPTPVVTAPAPVAGVGGFATVTTSAAGSGVMSLPYTAGNGLQVAALIAGLAAVLTVVITVLAKKTYLKQI